MICNPCTLLDGNSWKISLIPIFFYIFSYDFIVYAYFAYAATSSSVTNDVMKLVMHRLFNSNLQ